MKRKSLPIIFCTFCPKRFVRKRYLSSDKAYIKHLCHIIMMKISSKGTSMKETQQNFLRRKFVACFNYNDTNKVFWVKLRKNAIQWHMYPKKNVTIRRFCLTVCMYTGAGRETGSWNKEGRLHAQSSWF